MEKHRYLNLKFFKKFMRVLSKPKCFFFLFVKTVKRRTDYRDARDRLIKGKKSELVLTAAAH